MELTDIVNPSHRDEVVTPCTIGLARLRATRRVATKGSSSNIRWTLVEATKERSALGIFKFGCEFVLSSARWEAYSASLSELFAVGFSTGSFVVACALAGLLWQEISREKGECLVWIGRLPLLEQLIQIFTAEVFIAHKLFQVLLAAAL